MLPRRTFLASDQVAAGGKQTDAADDIPEIPASPASRIGDASVFLAITDWDRLLEGVFAAAMSVMAAAAQRLVNLGLVHRECTVVRYWDDWLTWMPRQSWRFFGWYVWDRGVTVPGDWAGRLAPRHEFIVHFNRQARKPTTTVPCKFAGQNKHLSTDLSSSGGCALAANAA